MKKYQIQSSGRKSTYSKNLQQTLKKQKPVPVSTPSMVSTIAKLMRSLRMSSQGAIQTFVDLKTSQFKAFYNLDFNILYTSSQLKYILFNLIELQEGNIPALNETYDQNIYENINPLQSNIMENTIKRNKTNIYIDLDFTQFLEKAQQELDQKQKIIEKLQDVMIDKDNQIDILQDQNQQLKRQIQQIFQETTNQNAKMENQKLDIEGKYNKIQDENRILHNQIGILNTQIKILQKQNEEQPDQFLRRCLLLQAISIQHYILDKK